MSSKSSSNIYMMRNTRNNYVKIGRSVNPKFRERTLQSQEPEVELFWTHEGTNTEEAFLHRKFKNLRLRGEWFNLSNEDVIYVSSLQWKKDIKAIAIGKLLKIVKSKCKKPDKLKTVKFKSDKPKIDIKPYVKSKVHPVFQDFAISFMNGM